MVDQGGEQQGRADGADVGRDAGPADEAELLATAKDVQIALDNLAFHREEQVRQVHADAFAVASADAATGRGDMLDQVDEAGDGVAEP